MATYRYQNMKGALRKLGVRLVKSWNRKGRERVRSSRESRTKKHEQNLRGSK